jgi:hypothetical protein
VKSQTSAIFLTPILKLIHSMVIVSKFKMTVLRTMASYAAAVCPFWQDAHRRMALVIARIQRAEESVNGETLFSSSSSAKCTEVELPPNGILSHHHQSAPRQTRQSLRSGRGTGILHS